MVSGQEPLSQRIAARLLGLRLSMAKAMGALTLLSNGTPCFSWARRSAETEQLLLPDFNEVINPQNCEFPPAVPPIKPAFSHGSAN